MKRHLVILVLMLVALTNVRSQSLCGTKKEQKAISENYEQIKLYVDIAAEDAFEKMRAGYSYPAKEESGLKRMFHDREWRKAAYNYMCGTVGERVREKQTIDSIYLDSINSVLMFYNGLSGRSVTLALKMRNVFKLSDSKCDFLMKSALAFARRKLHDRHDNFKREEMDALQKVLSRKQIEIVLNEKNRIEAAVRAQKV